MSSDAPVRNTVLSTCTVHAVQCLPTACLYSTQPCPLSAQASDLMATALVLLVRVSYTSNSQTEPYNDVKTRRVGTVQSERVASHAWQYGVRNIDPICTHTRTHIYVLVHMYACTYTLVNLHVYVYMSVYRRTRTHTLIQAPTVRNAAPLRNGTRVYITPSCSPTRCCQARLVSGGVCAAQP